MPPSGLRADGPTSAFDRSAHETFLTSSKSRHSAKRISGWRTRVRTGNRVLDEHANSVAVEATVTKSATRQPEVHMTDVLVPVFIPYARFLEVRARRLGIATEVTPPDGQCTKVAASSAPVDQSSAPAVIRALDTSGRGGVQQS